MDFDFTEDQTALRDAVARWVDKGFSFERRHAAAKAGGASRDVQRELAELGLAGLVIPGEFGGLAMGPVEAMVVMEELGRGLVHAPFAATQLVAPALLARAPAALQQRWLSAMAEGSALVSPALQEPRSRHRLDRVSCQAVQSGEGWQLTGQKSLVAAGDEADAFVVSALAPGASAGESAGMGLWLVERSAPGVHLRAYPTQCGGRAAELTLSSCSASLVTLAAWEDIERAADVGVAATCAEAVGLMDKLTALTAEYLNTRKQFGVAIGSFQSLRHRMADVKMQLELARSMSYFASLRLHADAATRRRALSQAKVQIGQSARFVGQQCVQLHGGIGVTDEYVGSHYFKRLTALEMAWGDTFHHIGEVSARMQDTAGVFA
jgi:alkylation response protein AidB-like acyl-CoA dehydrogenase